jgi:hypothetical protein
MLFQVGTSCLLILTRIVYFSYNVITTNTQKTEYQEELGTFFSQLTTQLFYLNYAKSFYVYTLSSKYFRSIFVQRIKRMNGRTTPNRTNNFELRQRNLNGDINGSVRTVDVQRTFGK